MENYISRLMAEVKAKNPGEPEFHQAVQEVVESLSLVLDRILRERVLRRARNRSDARLAARAGP